MDPLSDLELTAALDELKAWDGNGTVLVRTVECPSFRDAIALVGQIADVAEQLDHHPDIDIRWRTLRLHVASHDVGAVTAKDVELCRAIDKLAPHSSF